MFSRVVVPLDGSEVSERALEPAIDLAKSRDVPVLLIRAVDPPLVVGQVGAPGTTGISSSGAVIAPTTGAKAMYEDADREAQPYIDRTVQVVQRQGVKAEGLVARGRPSYVVAESVIDSDILVMSSHGRTGVKRWFMGSVAEDILKRTSVPVLLIRDGDS